MGFLQLVSGSYSLLQSGLLIVTASIIVEHALGCTGFSSCRVWARVDAVPGLQGTGSLVVVLGLSCWPACGIFPDQGLNRCPLHSKEDSTTGPPGKPRPIHLKMV